MSRLAHKEMWARTALTGIHNVQSYTELTLSVQFSLCVPAPPQDGILAVADLGFFKGRGHSGATIYRGGPSIMQFFLDYFVTWH